MEKYKSLNKTLVEFISTSNQRKLDAKCVNATCSRKKADECGGLKTKITTRYSDVHVSCHEFKTIQKLGITLVQCKY